MGERFESMDLPAARKACSHRQDVVFEKCGKCDRTVGLHCVSCKIQVTGCICTEVDRFGEAEAIKRIFEREGEEQAIASLKKAGIIIPKGFKL